MEQEGGEISEARENVSSMVERGQLYLTEKSAELGIEKIRPEVIAKAQEILISLEV